jgi:hypothetical protein
MRSISNSSQGQMSLHHVRLFHGSGMNEAPHRRIGFALRYIPTRIRQTAGHEDGATLVRGVDRFNNFRGGTAAIARDNDPDCLAFHAAMIERTTNILYRARRSVRMFKGPRCDVCRSRRIRRVP